MRKLPEDQPGEEGAGNRANGEWPNLEASDPVPRGDHQEKRELGVADQELFKPGQHRENPIRRPKLDRALSFCFASQQRREAFGEARKETLDIAQSSDRQRPAGIGDARRLSGRLPQMVARNAARSIESKISDGAARRRRIA